MGNDRWDCCCGVTRGKQQSSWECRGTVVGNALTLPAEQKWRTMGERGARESQKKKKKKKEAAEAALGAVVGEEADAVVGGDS